MSSYRFCFSVLIFLLFVAYGVFGHNGKIAFAYPMNKIKIDARLDDWPKKAQRFEISNFLGAKGDTKAFFRVGYNLNQKLLYVALEVSDDSNVKSNTNRDIWWNPEDRQILYLDFDHNPTRGSGVVGIAASQSGFVVRKANNNWDPYNSRLTERDINVEIRNRKGVTIYEWQIHLGDAIKPNKSIGLDMMIKDVDSDNTTTMVWSAGGAKIAMPFRLGDIMLLEESSTEGLLKGKISWNGNSRLALPEKVKIVSEKYDQLWTLAEVDSTGYYKAKLPYGTYRISPASKNVNAINSNGSTIGPTKKYRIDELKNVVAKVYPGKQSVADTLNLDWYSEPRFIIPKKGILFGDRIDISEIDNFINTYRKYLNIPGISLAVIKNGKVFYNRHFGVESTITKKTVSNSSIFEIASVSKIFFAFAVHRLAERGIINLDRPLFEYLPFEQIQHDERHKLITSKHILSHQSGLPNWLWGGPNRWKNNEKGELQFTPGTKYQYSGEGYDYLSRVVEEITGKDIETVVKEEVFGPMGMEHSSFFAIDRLKSNIVVGHSEDNPMFWDLNHEPWVAGSMYSKTEDMSKFAIGMMEGKALLEESYRQMFAPQVEIKEPYIHFFGGNKQSHSLGFELEDTPNGRIIHHGGNNGDFQSRFALHLEKKIGYILLSNNNNGFLLDLALQEFLFAGRYAE